MKTGAFIIPTGIGCTIGGFAGDGGKWVRLLSKKSKLIVNPNVVNAACFSAINDNMLYVEGYTLDRFFRGECKLKESTSNKIGVIFDKAIKQDVLNVHINTINAVKVVYGIDIEDYTITKEPCGVTFYVDPSGVSMGDVKNLDTLKDAANELIKKGCNAIAIVCRFPEDENEDYSKGIGVDPVGGVEAIISHYISKEFEIPCAHAPAFDDITITTDIVDPRAAAEYITPTFLPCILLGLSTAPQISHTDGIGISDIDFLCLPHNALGGIPALEMSKLNKKIFAIKENNSILNITNEKLNIKCVIIDTYKELLELL